MKRGCENIRNYIPVLTGALCHKQEVKFRRRKRRGDEEGADYNVVYDLEVLNMN